MKNESINATDKDKINQLEQNIAELEKERLVLDQLIKLNPYSIGLLDVDGHYIKWNQALAQNFGGAPHADYCLFNDPLLLKVVGGEGPIDALKKGETLNAPELEYNPHDIDPKFPDIKVCGRIVVFPIKNGDGNIESYVIMHEDTTRRKMAEEALHKALEESKHLVEEKTMELSKKVEELERFRKATIDREFRIKQLSDEIALLRETLKKNG